MTHNELQFISCNATMLNGLLQRLEEETAFIDERAAPLVKSGKML